MSSPFECQWPKHAAFRPWPLLLLHHHIDIGRDERPGTLEWHVVLDAVAYQISFVRPVPLAVQQLRTLVVELLVLRDDLPFVLPAALPLVPYDDL